MIPGKYSSIVTSVAACGIGMFVAMWLLDFMLVRTNWCAGVEASCFREWIGATSGWAGATAAGLTLLALYNQLLTQREQIEDQKRVTAFALGEASPMLTATVEGRRVVVSITNWNKRDVIITSLETDFLWGVNSLDITVSGRAFRRALAPHPIETGRIYFIKPIAIPGYLDRNIAPATADIMFVQTVGPSRHLDDYVEVHGNYAGDTSVFKLREDATIVHVQDHISHEFCDHKDRFNPMRSQEEDDF